MNDKILACVVMLEECLSAFEAIPDATKSRKLLKRLGLMQGTYGRNGSHVLAAEMVKRLRKHLGIVE